MFFGGGVEDEDVLITTTKEEIVKIMQDDNYIGTSFEEGNSVFEMIAGKTELAAKGYVGLYNDLTGVTISGFFIKNFDN